MKNKIALVLPLLFLSGCGTTDLKRTITVIDTVSRVSPPKAANTRSNIVKKRRTPKHGSTNHQPKNYAPRTIEKEGFSFGPLKCMRKGGVVCDLSVVSNQKDRLFEVFSSTGFARSTRAISATGLEYVSTSVSIGGSDPSKFVSRKMISGVPLGLKINFSSIPNDVKRFAALEVETRAGFSVQFKNVVITN